jgi:perosamine synthetase
MTGATPVCVDVEIDSWNASPDAIINLISEKTKAILVVHTYGLPVNLLPLIKICEDRKIHIVEDVAEAIGLKLYNRYCGSYGTISTFSFYPNKHVTTGEGGMILTDDPEIAQKCRLMRNLAFEGKRRFVHHHLAPNYRLTNMQAAIGLAQLEVLEQTIEMKKTMGRTYLELLEGFDLIQLPLLKTSYAENIFWVFGIVLHNQISLEANRLIELLKMQGIGCREFFWPIHEQPVFKGECFYKESNAFPVSSNIARRGLYLPSGIGLSKKDIILVCGVLKEVLTSELK